MIARKFASSVFFAFVLASLVSGCWPFINNTGPMSGPENNIDVFTRSDGKIVRCERLPPEIVNKSSSANVSLTIARIGEVLKGGSQQIINPERVTPTSVSLNDYRVIARNLCIDYANGIYTPEEYQRVVHEILPIVKRKAETEARVDSELEQPVFIPYAEKTRLGLTIRVRSVSTDNLEAAHVIYGLAVVHDEDQLPSGHESKPTNLSCSQVPSCIAAHLWDQAKDTIIVRGGDRDGALLRWTADIKKGVKAVRVYWELYQREADDGNRCIVDESKKSPTGGIPFLMVVDFNGQAINGAGCYKTYGEKVIPIIRDAKAQTPTDDISKPVTSKELKVLNVTYRNENTARSPETSNDSSHTIIGEGNGGSGTGSGGK